MIILKWVVKKSGTGVCTGIIPLRIGIRECCCEHGNEPSCVIKGGKFLDQLSDYKFLKKDPAPWS
jgi:hypothetical protein